jgi:hypothetical protein
MPQKKKLISSKTIAKIDIIRPVRAILAISDSNPHLLKATLNIAEISPIPVSCKSSDPAKSIFVL